MLLKHCGISLGVAALAVLYSSFQPAALAQSCDSLTGKADCSLSQPLSNISTRPQFNPMPSMSLDKAMGSDQPATLGSITFSGGTVCIGLLNRGRCN